MPTLTYSDYQACSIKGMIWIFFFFCQVYIPTYAKEFCIKRFSGRLSDGRHLDMTPLKRPPPKYLSLSMACGPGMELDQVLAKSLKEGETLHHLSLTQQSAAQVSSKLWGNPVVSASLQKWKKKIFWKAIFYLIWQIWPCSATRFPRCSLCNHMVQLLLKRGRYYGCVNIWLAYIIVKIFPRVDFSPLWGSGMRRAEVSGFRMYYCNLTVKHRQIFSFLHSSVLG